MIRPPSPLPETPIIVRDPSQWDRAVLAHTQAGFLQSAAWGRFKQQFGWAPARILLPRRGTGPAAAAQVLFRRVPYSPFTLGYIPRGPLLDYQDEGAIDQMLLAIDRLARRYRAIAITWELPIPEDPPVAARLIRRGLRQEPVIQSRSTRVIDLSPGLEAVTAQFHQKWRYNTRLARKRGVAVRAARSRDDLSRWYALYAETARRDGFVGRGEDYMLRFWLDTAGSGSTTLLLAEHEGALLAGVMLHRFGPIATYLYGASAEAGRNLMPNHLLQSEAMVWAAQAGAASYDLFGIADSDDPNEPLAGVTTFKAGFGGRTVRFAGAFDRVYHPLLYAAARRVRGGGTG